MRQPAWVSTPVRRARDLAAYLSLPSDWFLIPLAAVIGAMGGAVAFGFEALVEFSGEFFYGFVHESGHPAARVAVLLVLPAIGGLLVGLINSFILRKPPGHGIPEVVETVARGRDRLHARDGWAKAINSSLTIGSGGSAGVEGPIIHIGSTVGSVVAHLLGIGREHASVLIGAGAAATMAGIFNAPIAGVMFVLEVVLRDFSIKTFIPIVVASVFGTAVAQTFAHDTGAVFALTDVLGQAVEAHPFRLGEAVPYAALGLLCGLAGVALAASMRLSERLWQAAKLPRWVKPALGGLALGVLGLVFLPLPDILPGYGPPPFYGNGYTIIRGLLNPLTYDSMTTLTDTVAGGSAEGGVGIQLVRLTLPLLLAVLVCKLVGTCLTLGSGGSGGVMAPSLFLGAGLGAGLAMALQAVGFLDKSTPATYALAGMAGVIAATIHCPMTAFLMVFEITGDYRTILPIMLVATLATTSAQFLYRDSIYGAWLRERGISMGRFADMTLLRRLRVGDVPLSPAVTVGPDEPASRLVELATDYAASDFVVIESGGAGGAGGEDEPTQLGGEVEIYAGMVTADDLRSALVEREAVPLMIVAELMRTDLPTCGRGESLESVLDKFSRFEVASLAVVDDDGRVRGVMTRSRLLRQYQQALAERG